LEGNPDSLDYKTLAMLRKAGFNRISVGMQSAVDGELASVHRAHTFGQAQQAVSDARRAGFRTWDRPYLRTAGQDMKAGKERSAPRSALRRSIFPVTG
jgi:oxygen-independent coproporphyrinogen-3 oxidase